MVMQSMYIDQRECFNFILLKFCQNVVFNKHFINYISNIRLKGVPHIYNMYHLFIKNDVKSLNNFCTAELKNGSVYTSQLLCLMFIKLFKVLIECKSRLPIQEFSGYHCKQYLQWLALISIQWRRLTLSILI